MIVCYQVWADPAAGVVGEDAHLRQELHRGRFRLVGDTYYCKDDLASWLVVLGDPHSLFLHILS